MSGMHMRGIKSEPAVRDEVGVHKTTERSTATDDSVRPKMNTCRMGEM